VLAILVRVRLFVASAGKLLTDVRPNGEGLISWQILSRLAARGHELVVCARQAEFAAPPPFEVVELGRSLPANSLDPIALGVRAGLEFRRRRTEGFDAAYWIRPLDPPQLFYPAALLSVLPRRTPLVVGPVALPWTRRDAGLPPRVTERVLPTVATAHRLLVRRRARDLHAIVATPDVERTLVPAWRRNVTVLPLAVDTRRFAPTPLPDRPRVLYAGALERHKGALDVIEAFGRVAAALPEAELVVAGEGAERGALEAEVRTRGLERSVLLRGAVPHEDMPQLLSEATVLCSPSYVEAFGMAIVEALASARPVVAYAAGGPRHLVEEGRGGHLVAPGDTGALAARLAEVLRDPARAEAMGAHNRALAERRHDIERMVSELERILAGAAAGALPAAVEQRSVLREGRPG
jgi:glycosyltransferase involved in cell wall biosynthesis